MRTRRPHRSPLRPVRLLACGLLVAGIGSPLVASRSGSSGSPGREPGFDRSARDLSLADRVACQRAIEEVYHQHRLWPRENPGPKPPLSAVLRPETIARRAEDALLLSDAAAALWGRPVTPAQLQAEIDRMTRDTRDPQLLRDLYAALRNDPRLVAECLARPALAARQVREWYAFDRRFHDEVRARAVGELARWTSASELALGTGEVTELWFERVGEGEERLVPPEKLGPAVIELGDAELVEVVAAHGPAGDRVGRLREDADGFFVEQVHERNADRLRLTIVRWPKRGFDDWWREARSTLSSSSPVVAGDYVLTAVSGEPCTENTWRDTAGTLAGRYLHTAVWTGAEMIVWGGRGSAGYRGDGARFDPATATWQRVRGGGTAPSARRDHSAVWTGTEMIVWGGYADWYLADGKRYDPASDSWSEAIGQGGGPTPVARAGHTAVWTGDEMIVWGGESEVADGLYRGDGHRYDPASDVWSAAIGSGDGPSARARHTAVWTGSEMIVWGGVKDIELADGRRYSPSTNSWTLLPATVGFLARQQHTAVWTGSEMIVWGGRQGGLYLGDGRRYTPTTNGWSPAIGQGGGPSPAGRVRHAAVWTGDEMIVWGGADPSSARGDGARYEPASDRWLSVAASPLSPRYSHAAIWTGVEMIVWGGTSGAVFTGDGARYAPASNTWVATGSAGAPAARIRHSAVWTGSEMIIWGGAGFTDGKKYLPATDAWSAPIGAGGGVPPSSRIEHSAIWTGSELVIWGGSSPSTSNLPSDAGRYSPAADSWAPLGLGGGAAPEKRHRHSAVWTGTAMIVWGGRSEPGSLLASGGRYTPASDSWAPLGGGGGAPPTPRYDHTAVWTGAEMIVWGGLTAGGVVGDGGRYSPAFDSWSALTAAGGGLAPTPRLRHRAVWTGAEMIVWGGSNPVHLSDGKRYDPLAEQWSAAIGLGGGSTPAARDSHTALWTGGELIVWGGNGGAGPLYTGGRYSPALDAWSPTNTLGVPGAKQLHSGVWTGSQMIVWGGLDESATSVATGGLYCAVAVAGQSVVLELQAPSSTVQEAAGNALLTAVLTTSDGQPASGEVSISFTAEDIGSATPEGIDFTAVGDTFTFPPGTSSGSTGEIAVPITDDDEAESDEVFRVYLNTPSGCAVGPTFEHYVTIVDDDGDLLSDGFESGSTVRWLVVADPLR